MAVFSQLESLKIDGASLSVTPHSAGLLSHLRHLECSEGLFGPDDVLRDMPVLETLSLAMYPSFVNPWHDSVYLLVCMLRKPSLREIMFNELESAARSLYKGVATAVCATDHARMWWKPDLSALAEGVSAPVSLDKEDEVRDGWLLCACGPTSKATESKATFHPGLYSCTSPVGTWGVRVEWPTETSAPAGSGSGMTT